eukprot:3607836-Prorocentrum_lima.AAC.1
MTSSLVGSEMCIRDRLLACVRGAQGQLGCTEAGCGTGGDIDGCPGSLTVSYTHLTLPTICSV